nr:type II/IV secretion system ATPase subunit [Halorarius halobius]
MPPDEFIEAVQRAGGLATGLREQFEQWLLDTPVRNGEYTWEQFKAEYHYDDGLKPPRDDDGEVASFEPESWLGFDPAETDERLSVASETARDLRALVDHRTVNVNPDIDEDAFFSDADGRTTLTNRYDLEKAVPAEKKLHFTEVQRYWVNKPYAFVIIFHSVKDNEKKYYLVDPHLNDLERQLVEFLSGKLRATIKYSDDELAARGTEAERRGILERETRRLLDRYDLYEDESAGSLTRQARYLLDRLELDGYADRLGLAPATGDEPPGGPEGVTARPEPAVLAEDHGRLSEYQVHKLLYLLKRNFVGYERIDGVKHDINVEDISCDGYDAPIFVYHTDYEQMITNIQHDPDELDDFVVKLAQRSGKGISQRRPQVDATLPDGSRAQLTLGHAVSDHGTNYTIRQFKDVPFTPVDLINWNTFSLEQMAFIWLCIENERSMIFAGGTASGKTTSLNAVSLFIPNSTKVVSIEDTREVELPQRNWVASVTRPSFGTDDTGDVDEFDLLEAGLRQRPDYIVMGEVRGEEGRTLFQIMSTGHTTLTTFHADTVGEVLKRFTTDPINVSKTLFTTLDLVSVQTQTRIRGRKVRRNKALTEINHYDPENDEINVQDVYQWQPGDDEFRMQGDPNTLEKIRFDRGWDEATLRRRLFERQVVLAYLVENDLNAYGQVAATVQGFMNEPETILTLIATDRLAESLDDLREMESVAINVDPEKEALVPRPEPSAATRERARDVLETAENRLLDDYRDREARTLVGAVADVETAEDLVARPGRGEELWSLIDRVRDDLGLGDSTATDRRESATTDERETPAASEDGAR